jgi:hypothetical protein
MDQAGAGRGAVPRRAPDDTPVRCQLTTNVAVEFPMIERQARRQVEQQGGGPMVPFDALEVTGRERREALMAEAENDRLTRPTRLRARKSLVGKVSSLALSIGRTSLRSRRRPADWDLPVPRPERRPI